MLHPETFSIASLFQGAEVGFWLIGGQAIELVCTFGHEQGLRLHDDIDFFLHADAAARAVNVLEAAGFTQEHGSLQEGDLFMKRAELLLDLVPILPAPLRTLGGLADIKWPLDLLAPYRVRGVPTLTPAMHLAMKRTVSQFYGLPRREKDLLDVSALSALLA